MRLIILLGYRFRVAFVELNSNREIRWLNIRVFIINPNNNETDQVGKWHKVYKGELKMWISFWHMLKAFFTLVKFQKVALCYFICIHVIISWWFDLSDFYFLQILSMGLIVGDWNQIVTDSWQYCKMQTLIWTFTRW